MKVKQLLLGQLTKQSIHFCLQLQPLSFMVLFFIWEIISAFWIKHLIFMENTHNIQIHRAVRVTLKASGRHTWQPQRRRRC